MKKTIFCIIISVMAFGMGYAQDWAYSIVRCPEDSLIMFDAQPMPDGNIAVSSRTVALGTAQPAMLSLSPEGEVMARDSFPKPAFWGRYPRVLSDEEGTTYILTVYNPDHDSTDANYFLNFDNPPDYSILGLYKLDEQLSIVESHEHQIPVDTTDANFTGPIMFGGFNDYCGNIYVFSAFVDEGTVVGGYIKKPSFDYYHPHGYDSIFFFRMGFDGTLMRHVGYEMDPRNEPGGGGLNWPMALSGYNMFKVGSSYYCFLNIYPINGSSRQIGTDKSRTPGNSYRLDREFNIVKVNRYHQRSGLEENCFINASYIASRHNTAYLSCSFRPPGSSGYTGCALYEYALDADKAGILHIERYIERTNGSHTTDEAAELKGVALASDNSVYYAYSLEDGINGITIERLSADFDTLSTFFYVVEPTGENWNWVESIHVTETDDVLMTFWTYSLYSTQMATTVVKFPAEAFVGIEEAHASGLKVAVAYPNPGSGTLNICTGLPNARLEVYDATGRLIHGQEVTESETAIDAESWPSGMYVWKVYSNDKEAESGKWVKE